MGRYALRTIIITIALPCCLFFYSLLLSSLFSLPLLPINLDSDTLRRFPNLTYKLMIRIKVQKIGHTVKCPLGDSLPAGIGGSKM